MRSLTRVWIALVCLMLLGVPGVSQAQPDLPSDAILALDWSPDGAHIALGRQDGTVEIIDAQTGQAVALPDSGVEPTLAVAWSPDGLQLTSGSGDHRVRIWDMATGELQFALEGHSTPVDTIAWNPNPTTPELASGSATSQGVYVWNPAMGEELRVVPISGARAIAWDAAGLSLVAAQDTSSITAYDAVPGESFGAMLFVLDGHTDTVTTVDWQPITTQIASGGRDNTVRTWTTFALVTTFEGHTDAVTQVVWQPAGLLLASASLDGTLRVWDIGTWQNVDVVQGDGALYALDWHPDGTHIAYGGADGDLHVYEVESGMTEPTPSSGATSLFSDDFEGDISQWTYSEGWQHFEDTGNHVFRADPSNRRFTDDLTLQTPIDLSGTERPTLRYRSAHDLTVGSSGRVQVSADGGVTWIDVQTLDDSTDLAWVEQEIDLSAFAGETIRLRFHYEWVDLSRPPLGGTLPSRVWLIDDVHVTG